MPKNNPIENLYMIFCRAILGVQKQTSKIGTLLELGAVPIMFFGVKNCLKNWHRIHKKNEANSILLKVHQMATENNLPWQTLTKHHLDTIGIGSESEIENIHRAAFERLKDIYHQNCFAEINSDHSKLRTYARVKTEIGMEEYLNSTENIKDRTALTKIRLSNHDLMIEKGRHRDLDENERLCPFCDNAVENEQHFILECGTFRALRVDLLAKVTESSNSFNTLSENDKFCFLLSEPDAAKQVGAYLNKTLHIRRFLLENHKQNG